MMGLMGLPLAFAEPLVLLGLAQPAGAVVAAAADPAAAAPHRFRADPAPVRPHAQGGDAAAHAVVAHAAAPDARRAGDHRGRRAAVASAGRDRGRQGAAGAADRRRLSGGRHLGCAHAHRRRPDGAGRGRRPRRRPHPAVGADAATSRSRPRRRRACGSSRSGRSPMRSSAPTRCRALGRFLDATPDAEIVWLSDGVDLGGGTEFVAALGRLDRDPAAHRDRGRACRPRMR